jgi:ketosteroid isomerase-like protein
VGGTRLGLEAVDATGEWVDRFEIQQVLYRYFDAINRGDLEALRALFAADAVWEHSLMGLRFESADAYVDFLGEMTGSADLLMTMPACPVVELIGADEARATTTVHEIASGTAAEDSPFGAKGTQVSLQTRGIYYDRLARIDGSWRFTRRRYVVVHHEVGALPGEIGAPRASLLDGALPSTS